MTYVEAIEAMKRGRTATHDGKAFRIGRGVEDVTDPANPTRAELTDADRSASDWAIAKA